MVTEWFDEHENDVNQMQRPSQSSDLHPIEHTWDILEWSPRQGFPPPSTKLLMEEWCRIPPIEFQILVESMPRCIEAVLTCGDPTPYVGVSFVLVVS